MTDRVCVVVPALDEQDSVGLLVTAVLEQGIDCVLVVDNGSTDETAARARASGATVLHEPRRGYGWACAAGSEHAVELGASVIAYVDADLSSDPSQIDLLIGPITAGDADLTLGSRTSGEVAEGSMPPHQRLGNSMGVALLKRLYRIPVTDIGPFRAIRVSSLDLLDMSETHSGWPVEMIVRAAKADLRIVEVPVAWNKRHAGRSKVSGSLLGSVRAGIDIIRVIAKHRIR